MNTHIGKDALKFIDSLLTPEEIAKSNLWVALIRELIKVRQEKVNIQRGLLWKFG